MKSELSFESAAKIIAIILALSCNTFALDTDSDGLDNSVETNKGVYVSVFNTGTNPRDSDTDNDYLEDGLEVTCGRNPNVAELYQENSHSEEILFPWENSEISGIKFLKNSQWFQSRGCVITQGSIMHEDTSISALFDGNEAGPILASPYVVSFKSNVAEKFKGLYVMVDGDRSSRSIKLETRLASGPWSTNVIAADFPTRLKKSQGAIYKMTFSPIVADEFRITFGKSNSRLIGASPRPREIIMVPDETPSSLATLSEMSLSVGTITPAFHFATPSYFATVSNEVKSLSVITKSSAPDAIIEINGIKTLSGKLSSPLPLKIGKNNIDILVKSQDASTNNKYSINVERLEKNAALDINFSSEATKPLTVPNYTTSGKKLNISLSFSPSVGANLKVINNTGLDFIHGNFDNLAHGQQIDLFYKNVKYSFVANYYGGSGNDLVLQWIPDKVTTTNTNFVVDDDFVGNNVVSVSSGVNHSLALYSDGKIVAWGDNQTGQLGNGTDWDSPNIPVQVKQTGALSGKTVVAISAGESHSLALCSDGTVVAWGNNWSGQLGNGTNNDSTVPVRVKQNGVLKGKTVVAVSAGGNHSIALCSDGTVAAWGNGSYGQLGNGETSSRNIPVLVRKNIHLDDQVVVAVSAGRDHNLALCSDGSVLAWGSNDWGQLGYFPNHGYVGKEPEENEPVPAYRTYGKIIVSISAGKTHSLALSSDGKVLAWGDNRNGQRNINQKELLKNRSIVKISAGEFHSIALCSDGTIACWGKIDASIQSQVTKKQILNGKSVIDVSADSFRIISLCSDGTVASWDNFDTSINPRQVIKRSLLSEKTIATVSAGGYHSCALCTDGTLVAWGSNKFGQLGDQSGLDSSVPVRVMHRGALKDKTVISISVGWLHTLALCSDGTLVTWGDNLRGQLGNNSTIGSSKPLLVERNGVLKGKTVVSVAAGWRHSLALCSDGTVASWGANSSGQLGNNSKSDSVLPVLVDRTGALSGKTVVALSAGESHSLALCSDGTLVAWGANWTGQLGNGRLVSSSVPVQVSILTGKEIIAISAGRYHSLALCSDGRVAAWGSDIFGQLGNGTIRNGGDPVMVTQTGALEDRIVVGISAGEAHSLALCSDGTVAAWGDYNRSRLLGNPLASYQRTNKVPIGISNNGLLKGKSVIAMDAGPENIFVCGLSSVSTLKSLKVSNSKISPKFSSSILNYSCNVSNDTSFIKVTPDLVDLCASIKVNGVTIMAGRESGSIPLVVGNNVIRVVVTSADGVTTKKYTIKVNRAKSLKTSLPILALKNDSLGPKSKTSGLSYSAPFPFFVKQEKVNATAERMTSMIINNKTCVKTRHLVFCKNTDPKIQTSMVYVNGKRHLQLLVVKPSLDFRCIIEVSSDLLKWSSGDHHTSLITNNDRILIVRDKTPLSADSKRFIRIKK